MLQQVLHFLLCFGIAGKLHLKMTVRDGVLHFSGQQFVSLIISHLGTWRTVRNLPHFKLAVSRARVFDVDQIISILALLLVMLETLLWRRLVFTTARSLRLRAMRLFYEDQFRLCLPALFDELDFGWHDRPAFYCLFRVDDLIDSITLRFLCD